MRNTRSAELAWGAGCATGGWQWCGQVGLVGLTLLARDEVRRESAHHLLQQSKKTAARTPLRPPTRSPFALRFLFVQMPVGVTRCGVGYTAQLRSRGIDTATAQ
jgi:hypothetical protein